MSVDGTFQAIGPQGFGTYSVRFEGGQPQFEPSTQSTERILAPGFVDIHIHGGFGIDFMSATREQTLQLCHHLEGEGYEAFLPTTVTSDVQAVHRALKELPEHPMIWGFHAEGPFISSKYPGAQPPQFITNPPVGASEWDEVLDDPRLRVITLAPELPHALDLITRLSRRGVKVGMGHTNATYAEASAGFQAGASHTTHTYNAMRPLHHREAGTVGFALQEDGLTCELIYDRLHVCKEAAALLLKCKPKAGVVGISDGTMAAGLPEGTSLKMWDLDVQIGKGDVRLPDGTLAGSAVTLHTVFKNLLEDFGPEVAIQTCCLNPRSLLGHAHPPQVWLELDQTGNILHRSGGAI